MANTRLSMRKIKEVLRLTHDGHLNTRQVALSLNISRSTVKRALEGLATGGAIEIRPRYLPNGARTSNEYVTLWRRPRTGR